MKDRLGIVSNCWQLQIESGLPIAQSVEQVLELGLRFVELRQGSLGDCETEQRVPIPGRLAKLAAKFPEATFNLAVEMPLITGSNPIDDQFTETCVDAAVGLATSVAGAVPHLRIVDLAGNSVAAGQPRRDSLATLSRLSERLHNHSQSAVISLEHSIQPWPAFRDLFDEARQDIDLRLCLDPCNFWLCDNNPSISDILDSIPIAHISMLHVKQRMADSPCVLPGLVPDGSDSGSVPWPSTIRRLQESGYRGPILLETAPCANIIEQLQKNCRQIEEWSGKSSDAFATAED